MEVNLFQDSEGFRLLQQIMDFDWWSYLLLPGLIFLARVIDVSLGTVRIMMVASGRKNIAPLLGGIESLIWLLAIGQIMANLDNWLCYLTYAGGFAMGTYVGMRIEERLALGNYIIRIIADDPADLITHLRSHHYQAVLLEGEGNHGSVSVVFLAVRRKQFDHIIRVIRVFSPQAMYTVELLKYATDTMLPNQNRPAGGIGNILRRMRPVR